MPITLELTPEEEIRLREAADAEGKDIIAYIRHRVFATALNPAPPGFSDDELAFLQQNAADAIRAAQRRLLEQGIGYAYERADGVIVRRLPDGTEKPLDPEEFAGGKETAPAP